MRGLGGLDCFVVAGRVVCGENGPHSISALTSTLRQYDRGWILSNGIMQLPLPKIHRAEGIDFTVWSIVH